MKIILPLALLITGPILVAQESRPASEQQGEDSTKVATSAYEEVVAIGTRSAEKIIDIPYSVFTVDKKELGYGKKVSAKDVLADVPGLFLQSRYGNHDLRISLRGFGTRSNSGVRGVRVLQDGIPISEPDGETVTDLIDFTSLGGVEVVKGNLSSLYANAPGGVINFSPDLSFQESYAGVTGQKGGHGMMQSGFKLGLVSDISRFLLTYNYLGIEGYRAHSAEYQHLVNSAYVADITERSKITILGNYAYGLNKLPGSLTAADFAADPFQAQPLAITQNFKRFSRKGQVGMKFLTRFGELGNNEVEAIGYGGLKELELAESQTYTISTRYSLGGMLRYSNRTLIDQERRNLFTIGMDYAYQAGPVTEFDNLLGVKGPVVNTEYQQNLSNVGFYALDRIDVVPQRFEVLLSGRFDRFAFARNLYIPSPLKDTTRAFAKLSPKIAATFKLTPSIALYSSYGLSYDFPALAEMGNTPLSSNTSYSINPDLNPQRSYNYELGLKGNIVRPDAVFMPKIVFDITYFNYMVNDEIVPFIILQKAYFRNAAKTHRQGIEAGFKSEPFKEVEFTVNYTYTRFRYKDYPVEVPTASGTIKKNYAGNIVPSVPANIFNLILAHELELAEGIDGLILWDCDYIGKMEVDDENTQSTPPYFYGNIMAGLTFELSETTSIVVYGGVNNIFDKRYVGFVNINDYFGQYFETGEPRTAYAGLKFNCRL